jgi:RNA polymerase sigma-70 factor (ECF subfamily)
MSFEPKTALDEDLARESQAGSIAAFEELVHRYEARVYRFILQLCRNPADAAELTQDTFVKAFQAIAAFNHRQPFGPWLFTIARRKCIDRHRCASRSLPEMACDPSQNADRALDPAESLAAREDKLAIWDIARERLSPLQFQALWLRYVEDMSLTATAAVLRKPQAYVKVLLFRARQILSRKLRPYAGLNSFPARRDSVAIAPLPLRSGFVQNPHS